MRVVTLLVSVLSSQFHLLCLLFQMPCALGLPVQVLPCGIFLGAFLSLAVSKKGVTSQFDLRGLGAVGLYKCHGAPSSAEHSSFFTASSF